MQTRNSPSSCRGSALPTCLLSIAATFVLASSCGARYTVTLTAAEIHQALEKKLPVSKSKLLATATVRALNVEFPENSNRILVRPEVDLGVVGQSVLHGRAIVEGQIRYAPDTGEFFLDQPKVKDVTIDGLPGSVRPIAEDLVTRFGEGYLGTTPIYRLKQSDFKQSLAKLVLKSVQVHAGRVEIEIGTP